MEYYDIGAIKKQLIDWHLARDIINSWLLYVTSTLAGENIFIVIAVVVSLANLCLVDRHENPYGEIVCMMNAEASGDLAEMDGKLSQLFLGLEVAWDERLKFVFEVE